MEKNSLIKNIETLNKKFGLKTVFYDSFSDELGYTENDTIYLNTFFMDDLVIVNEHELLHNFEQTEKFKNYQLEVLGSLSDSELEKIRKNYELKYFNIYTESQIKSGILDTEIFIDILCENGEFSVKLDVDKIKLEIFSEQHKILTERRYLNITLSNKIEQKFPELSNWEKLFVLNFYNSNHTLPNNKETKYSDVRSDIEKALNKIYKFAEDKKI